MAADCCLGDCLPPAWLLAVVWAGDPPVWQLSVVWATVSGFRNCRGVDSTIVDLTKECGML